MRETGSVWAGARDCGVQPGEGCRLAGEPRAHGFSSGIPAGETRLLAPRPVVGAPRGAQPRPVQLGRLLDTQRKQRKGSV